MLRKSCFNYQLNTRREHWISFFGKNKNKSTGKILLSKKTNFARQGNTNKIYSSELTFFKSKLTNI